MQRHTRGGGEGRKKSGEEGGSREEKEGRGEGEGVHPTEGWTRSQRKPKDKAVCYTVPMPGHVDDDPARESLGAPRRSMGVNYDRTFHISLRLFITGSV